MPSLSNCAAHVSNSSWIFLAEISSRKFTVAPEIFNRISQFEKDLI